MNSSTIAPGQILQVRLPTLTDGEVVVPATAKVAFDLNVKDGTPVNNTARSIMKRIEVVVDGDVILSINNASIFCYFMNKQMSNEFKEQKSIECRIIGNNDGSDGDSIKARLNIGTASTTENIMNTKDVYGK